MNPAPLLVSPPRDGPIIDLGSEHRYEGEYDQHPRRKASVPNENVNHECDSSFDAAGRPRQPLPEKSAIVGRDGGFSFADLQHPPQSNAPNDDAAGVFIMPKRPQTPCGATFATRSYSRITQAPACSNWAVRTMPWGLGSVTSC